MRIKQPKTRYELYQRVLRKWYQSEKEMIRLFAGDRRRIKLKELREKYDEYLQMWEDIRI